MTTCPGRRPSPRRHGAARVACVASVLAAAALLAAACGDGSPPSAGGSSDGATSATAASAVRYSTCMRAHGVPDYPDPNSSGQLPKITPASEAQLGVSETRFNAAQTACQRQWPYQGLTQTQQRQELADALTFARCMRANGVPTFPDPTTDPASGRAEFVITPSSGIDPGSAQIHAEARVCERGLPSSMLPSSPDGVEVTVSPGGGS